MRIEVDEIENGYLVEWHSSWNSGSRYCKTHDEVRDLVKKKLEEWFEA
ncbi:hypothetical protein ES703_00008 [subsurface metagenome]